MIRPARPAAALALILALGLGGCITLFPKDKPAQLYRFEADAPPAATESGPPVTIRSGAVEFDPASGGDRILTVQGEQVAYIGGARWAVPAATLFDEAVLRTFDAAGGRVRIVGAGAGKADYKLSLQVTSFETRYVAGPTAAPTVVIHLHGILERQSDLKVIAEKEIDVDTPAADNRVSAIVDAYRLGVTQTVGQLLDWVNQSAKG
jgi:cholesterol transport system auxiliary component